MSIHQRFVVVSDGHYNQDQTYRDNHDDALTTINAIHNDRAIDFVVHNGDVVHDDESVHTTVISEFFDQLPTTDYHVVFGNHDWATDDEWQNIYGEPKNYAFERGDYGFVIVETGQPRDAESQSNYTPADPKVVESLISEVDHQDGIVVFQHIAPYEDSFDGYGSDAPDVRDLYARTDVRLVVTGHNHDINWVAEDQYGATYAYPCRLGGVDLGTSYGSIDDWGVRVVDIYDDGTIETWQEGLNNGTLNSDTLSLILSSTEWVRQDGQWVDAAQL